MRFFCMCICWRTTGCDAYVYMLTYNWLWCQIHLVCVIQNPNVYISTYMYTFPHTSKYKRNVFLHINRHKSVIWCHVMPHQERLYDTPSTHIYRHESVIWSKSIKSMWYTIHTHTSHIHLPRPSSLYWWHKKLSRLLHTQYLEKSLWGGGWGSVEKNSNSTARDWFGWNFLEP